MPSRRKLTAKERETAFLLDVASEIEDIGTFTANKNFVDFTSDRMMTKAILKSLENIAEASKKITASFKKEHPEVEWKKIQGFRNILVHHYWDVDHVVVWEIVTEQLGSLFEVVKAELDLR